ncbi:MAG: alpha/beta hydrolase [Spirochaetales bacterium]|nr:alpha/beta hydrolase [Spirochaetales bacterium]
MKKLWLPLIAINFLTFNCKKPQHEFLNYSRQQLIDNSAQWESNAGERSLLAYRSFYGLDTIPDVAMEFRRIGAAGEYFVTTVESTKALADRRQNCRTIVFFHGYLDHSMLAIEFIRHFSQLGFDIVLADLPGHGLSKGEPGAIDDFSSYKQAIEAVLEFAGEKFGQPVVAVGHSTGAAGLIEYIRCGGDIPEKYVFLAPLVKVYMMEYAVAAVDATDSFLDYIPTRRGKSTSDKAMKAFMQIDSLGVRKIPLDWMKAAQRWLDDVTADGNFYHEQVLILQGEKDKTVDYKFNMDFLQKRFTNAEIIMLPEADHCLHYEREEIRTKVFEQIED